MNVFEYDPNMRAKHACTVDVTVVYDEPKMSQIFILLINHAIEMKSLNPHLTCPTYCHMNGVVIDEVPKLMAPVPNAIQIMNSFDATHPLIIS